MLQGRKIAVRDGVCVTESGALAGSNLKMSKAVENAAAMQRVGLVEAVNMATRNPATFIGLDKELGRIAPGYRASLVAVHDNLNVLESWVDGAPAQDIPEGRSRAS